MNKLVAIAFGVVVVLLVSFFVLNAYIYTEKQRSGEIVEPYRATLSGEYVCLPHIDESGPQTDECANGIKTDVGEYYAVDLNLMSQSQILLVVGQNFTANGVITPIERLSTDLWKKYPVIGIFSITDSVVTEEIDNQPWECNADAQICPDGSAVGRTGKSCEFRACPVQNATSAVLTTYQGGSPTALNVTVSPKEVVSDSRCPADVTCVWAGTVEVRTVLSTQVSHGEHVLTLGTPQVFGDYVVTLIDVTPAKTQEAIPESSYRFTFKIEKR